MPLTLRQDIKLRDAYADRGLKGVLEVMDQITSESFEAGHELGLRDGFLENEDGYKND